MRFQYNMAQTSSVPRMERKQMIHKDNAKQNMNHNDNT